MPRSSPRRLLALVTAAAVLASMTAATVAAPASAAKPRCQGKVATIVGTRKGERIVGTAKRDIIVAKGGADRIFGRGGNDIICAGDGNDRVVGNAGIDKLIGGRGADRMFGGSGPDRLFGGPGPDTIAGQPGNDVIDGGLGVDTCYQGLGTGPVVRCERPVAPQPTAGTLVVGGSGSGQVAGTFDSADSGATWVMVAGCGTNFNGVDRKRMALEFPLSGLPAGSSVTKATLDLHHALGTQLTHSLRGYAGNGTIEVADIEVSGTAVTFPPSAAGTRTTVDVTSLVTPTAVASTWAGLAMRKDVNDGTNEGWGCKAALPIPPGPPTLTIDYLAP